MIMAMRIGKRQELIRVNAIFLKLHSFFVDSSFWDANELKWAFKSFSGSLEGCFFS